MYASASLSDIVDSVSARIRRWVINYITRSKFNNLFGRNFTSIRILNKKILDIFELKIMSDGRIHYK